MPLDETDARAWCTAFAATLSSQRIDPQGVRYLDRYFVGGWSPQTRRPGAAVFLHHFVGSDPDDAVHSHPWTWGCSLILAGSYEEHRCAVDGRETVRVYRPGEVNILQPDDRHRIVLVTPDVWTLFLAGSFAQPWEFFPACGGA